MPRIHKYALRHMSNEKITVATGESMADLKVIARRMDVDTLIVSYGKRVWYRIAAHGFESTSPIHTTELK